MAKNEESIKPLEFEEKSKANERLKTLEYLQNLVENAQSERRMEDVKNLNEIKRLINNKKYGLVWEEHNEDVEELMKKNIPLFKENKEKMFVDVPEDKSFNFLLEGDNLHSLHLLEKTHKSQIDAIYIDPPYNTGAKTWRYNNTYVDSQDTFKHSKWISFMNSRLKIAKDLLRDKGIIVVTIDDYEIENLTLLMNEIFGEENHLGTVIIKSNPQGRSSVTGFQVSHEYALFYGRKNSKIGRIKRNNAQKSRYKEQDEFGSPFEWRNFRAQYSTESPTMVYPIYVKKDLSDFRIPKLEWNDKKKEYIVLEEPMEGESVTWPIDAEGRMRTWKWSIDTVNKSKDTEMGVRLDRQKKPAVYYKGRMINEDMLPFTFWDAPEYSASTFGANLLADIIGKGKFNYPKSLHAVEDALRVATGNNKDALILDFFAGSGTTGHAVMTLNKEDNGDRRFILATNNENNIAEEVTYERLRNISKGVAGKTKHEEVVFEKKINLSQLKSFTKKPEKLSDLIDMAEVAKSEYQKKNSDKEKVTSKTQFKDGILKVVGSYYSEHKFEPLPMNLKYYKTDYIEKNNEALEFELLNNVRTLVELQNGVDLDSSTIDIILELYEVDEKNFESVNTIYIRRQVRVVLTPEQEKKLSSIKLIDIPESFFAREMKELGL
ncbi:site-specific DNA-methyltransferase [Marinilactibacillus psychrotolerans]|uniref:Site-specific DNA-methyltransferase n=1 Tax=Marinilactibacillus psychrotolerans TaxID=191770 RepID=A0A5R9C2T8_9LACT|nr:site-specific DNA-methyltransferase [Marinilactibacillus psychrotolerans]TLQ07039.1 site-specific DNA-methyltransferase [Marinilactibacillus psychrotolerans]